MSDALYEFISLDGPALLSALFAALACALVGNFLVLRKMSLMGDAISHSVLPGIVIAFLWTGSRVSFSVFLGAAAAGVLTAVLVEVISRLGRLESGAAMGVVFSIFFAGGVVMMEQAAARNVDLDADCLLHGQLETVFWFPPRELSALLQWATISELPSELVTSFFVALCVFGFVLLLYKELMLSSFDPALSTALGFNARLIHLLLMVMVAAAVVASFRVVGSILVIAMLICPAAIARLSTDRMRMQLILSVVFATVAVVAGYVSGGFGPIWLGLNDSVSASGMMTVWLGLLLGSAVIGAPHYGVLPRVFRARRLAEQVAREDLVAFLYRAEEMGQSNVPERSVLEGLLGTPRSKTALRRALRAGEVERSGDSVSLRDTGRVKARALVRTHRLWELYLVNRLGLRPDHVHQRATELEHFTTEDLAERLAERESYPVADPHGREIPVTKKD